MKITFLSPTVNMGGGTRVLAIQARELQRRGHEVVIVSPPHPKPSVRDMVRHLLGRTDLTPPKSYLEGLGLDHRVLDTARPIGPGDVPDADVIVATWWETAEWVAAMPRAKGAKAYFVQGHEVWEFLPVERSKATYRLPLHKIVVARWLADLMRDTYGDPVVDIVPNSVDHAQFHAPPRGKAAVPTVGFIYSTTPLKGVDMTMRVVDRLRQRFPDRRVITFGSQKVEETLARSIGFVRDPAQDRIKDLYAACDLWLVGSRSEGFGLPAVEAMACRTPIVATRTGWPAEALNGANGTCIDIDDEAAMFAAAERILALPDADWRTMSHAACETVRDMSWERSAQMLEQALAHAVRRAL